MELLVWNENFSVGIREFDQHHKILFEMINSLIIAKEKDSSSWVIASTLEQLETYTIFHFAAEESMMKHFGFDGYETHQAEHEALLTQVKDMRKRYTEDESVSIDELLEFVAAWVLDHTMGMDKLYGPFLQHHVG